MEVPVSKVAENHKDKLFKKGYEADGSIQIGRKNYIQLLRKEGEYALLDEKGENILNYQGRK